MFSLLPRGCGCVCVSVCLGEGGGRERRGGKTRYCRMATVPARNGLLGESRVQTGSRWKAETRTHVLKSGLSSIQANCP